MPLLQQVYVNASHLRFAENVVIELFDDLQLSETRGLRTSSIDQFGNQESEPLVEIQDVSFSYFKKAPNILNCISMTIAKGDCVGIVGPTGGGKTTLVDLLSGLIFADKGKVIVNGQPLNAHNAEYWRNHLAYVAQDDVILDTSLLQNVVFGRKQNEGSAKRVKELLELVQLEIYWMNCPMVYSLMWVKMVFCYLGDKSSVYQWQEPFIKSTTFNFR